MGLWVYRHRTAQTCFYHLRRLRSIRRQLGRTVTARLVSAFVLSRLDYCNGRPCRPSGFNVGAVPASAACRSSFGAESPATRLRVCGFEGAALAPSRTMNRLQAVLVSTQVIAWSSAGVHHQHVEGSCWRPVIDHVARNYVVPRTNRRLGERAFSVAAAKAWDTTHWPPDSYLFNGRLQTSLEDMPFQRGLRLTFTLLLV